MPGREVGECPQALIDGLFSRDQRVWLSSTRKIKNMIIGNRTKKSSFMLLGVIPRLVSLLEDDSTTFDLVYEVVVTLGSFCHGTEENVSAVLSTRALPLLVNGLGHMQTSVVSACVRTLRTLYVSGMASSSPIFDNIQVARQLVSLLDGPPTISQCAAVVLSKSCQHVDHQNLLCSLGASNALFACLQSGRSKSVQCALQCLSSIVHENKNVGTQLMKCSSNSQSLVSIVTKIITSNHGNDSKLAAAQCLTYLCRAGVISPDSSLITLKVLPCLMRLSWNDLEMPTRTASIRALAYLTSGNPYLQELAAESDRLIDTLVKYLGNCPDETDELITQEHMNQFDRLCESVFLLLASLTSSLEEVRIKIASEHNYLQYLSDGLKGSCTCVKIAAARCLHSLTRSTKLLRTSLADWSVWKLILHMLSLCEDDVLVVSTGLICNLLLAFSPSRQKLVEMGAVERLSVLSFHDNATIQLNAVWALMSVTYDCDKDIKERIKKSFGYKRLFMLCSPGADPKLLMKVIGIFINIIHDSEEAEMVISNHGNTLLSTMARLLQEEVTNEIKEQVLCVLVNLSNASRRVRDVLVECEQLMTSTSRILHHCDCNSLLIPTCQIIENLADSAQPDHVHRQNVMEGYGIKIALQKLEKNEKLRQRTKEALEHFMSHSL